jgi:phage terminase large subunit
MTTAAIELPKKLVPILSPMRGSVSYRAMYGGRGGAKSFSVALVVAVWGYAERLRILCVREFQASIKESFHAELKAAIESQPWLAAHYDVGVDYIKGANGTEFIFRGLRRNEQSIKSLAKIDVTIVEEAEDVPETGWLALEATVFRQPKSEIIVLWNPRDEGSPVDKRFRQSAPANALITEINWQDNPFFPPGLDELRRREQQRLDPATYAWVWEGAYRQNSHAQVFHGKVHVEEFEPGPQWDGPYYGGDFGFSQDPTAAVEVWRNNEDVFIRREIFRKGLELDDTAQAVISAIPGFEQQVSRWDNARPESISHLKRHGLPNATSVNKWPGSVEDGIAFLRGHARIVIHPDCVNMQREARLYSYKVNDAGDPTTKIVDAHNHGWDAVRYAVAPLIRHRQTESRTSTVIGLY